MANIWENKFDDTEDLGDKIDERSCQNYETGSR